MESPEIRLAQQLADALNAIDQEFYLATAHDEHGMREYTLCQRGRSAGWKEMAGVAWDEDEQKHVVVHYT